MIKKLAIWYLKKKNVQVIINIKFLKETTITGTKNNNFETHNIYGEKLTINSRSSEDYS